MDRSEIGPTKARGEVLGAVNPPICWFLEEVHLTNMPRLRESDMAQSVQLDLLLK
jgi:hypothetical protein